MLLRADRAMAGFYLLAAAWAFGQTAAQVRAVGKFEPGHPIERELAAQQTDEYTVEVKQGQFIRVVARQMGVNVVVTILDPSGKTVLQVDRPNGAFGPEAASFIGETSGDYRVQLSSLSAGLGRYRMESLEAREPTQPDRDRIEAERAAIQALSQFQAGNRAVALHSIELYEHARSIWGRLGDKYEEGLCSHGIGLLYANLGDRQKTLENMLRALPLYAAANDPAGQGTVLNFIGNIYNAVGEKQAAVESLLKAIPFYHAAGDQAGEAADLNLIGVISYSLAEQRKALEYYGQAVAIFHTVGDRASEAATRSNIGVAYSVLGEKQKALDSYGQALPLYRAIGDRASEATTLRNIGDAYSALGDRQKALDYYGQALPLSRAAGDRSGEATTLSNIGVVYSALGEMQKALEFAGQSLPLFRATGNRAGEAGALGSIGFVYSALGEKQKALEYYAQALPILHATGERTAEATTLRNIGDAYSDLGQNQKAMDYFAQALPITRAIGDRSGEAMTLNSVARVYSDLGEEQKALDSYGQALPLVRSVGDRTSEAATLNNIGHSYANLGEKQKALDDYAQALPLSRAVGDRAGQAAILNNMGSIYLALGETRKALDAYQQALPVFREVGNRSREARTLNNIGVTYSHLGNQQTALVNYGQALAIYRAIAERAGEATTLINLGAIYDRLGDRRKALDSYGQAIPLLRAVGDRSGEATALSNVSSMFEKSQPEVAVLFEKQAVNLLQAMREDNRQLDAPLRESFERSIEFHYRWLASLLIRRERFGEAEEVLNLLKDKEAADFIRRDAVTDQLKPATLLDSERKALERYEQIVNQIVSEGESKSALMGKRDKAELSATEIAQAGQLDTDLAAANRVLLRFLQEQEKAFAPDSAVVKRTGEFREEAAGVQKVLRELGPGVVAIYTIVTPDQYIAMLVTGGARKAYSTAIKETDFNQKIFEFRQRLQNPTSDPLPLAKELYHIVFPEGLRQDLDAIQAKTIMWSIDNTLRYVPLAALHDGRGYLVERFRNSLITPASLPNLTKASTPVWDGTGFGVSEAKADFKALPSVPAELHGIFRQKDTEAAPIAGGIRLNGDFTRESFENDLRAKRNHVVHIATHFDSKPGVAANSHLLLGDGSELSLAEIEEQQDLFDGVDLLTLSACSTAFTTRSEDGREVDSFGTIAQRLGAKGVIASLWSVNDDATARLMETMYRIRQGKPELGKSEALRQAQEQMASGVLKPAEGAGTDRGAQVAGTRSAAKAWVHPYYWAPFILIGNWK